MTNQKDRKKGLLWAVTCNERERGKREGKERGERKRGKREGKRDIYMSKKLDRQREGKRKRDKLP